MIAQQPCCPRGSMARRHRAVRLQKDRRERDRAA
jgi:hypothetical protein